MEMFIEFVQTNISYAPYAIFGLLLLAGFNLPVPEDLMIFTSAILAAQNPEYGAQLFIAVFMGAYLSDVICYWIMGRVLGQRIFKIKMFSKMVSQEKIDKVTHFYDQYGMVTLLVGRFIPFGVLNALFFTAGLGKMNAWKFCLTDLVACIISCSLFFYLYYTYGVIVVEYIKKGNMVIFGIFALLLGAWFLNKKRKNRVTT